MTYCAGPGTPHPARWIISGTGPYGTYNAGACQRHYDTILISCDHHTGGVNTRADRAPDHDPLRPNGDDEQLALFGDTAVP